MVDKNKDMENIEKRDLEEVAREVDPYFTRENSDISFINEIEEEKKVLYSFRFPNRHGAIVTEDLSGEDASYSLKQVIWKEIMDFSDWINWSPISVADNVEGVELLVPESQRLTKDETKEILEKLKLFEDF